MIGASIQKVLVEDLKKLQEIGQQTFSETFAKDNTEENLASYLEKDFSSEKLLMELNTLHSEFYFALQNHQVIGYLKINIGSAQTELKDENGLEIERIYVLKEFHGKKMGQFLLDKAFEIAKQRNMEYLWLGVWEKNPKAIQFYKKNGFIEFDQHLFVLGDDEQTDIMMKHSLSKNQ